MSPRVSAAIGRTLSSVRASRNFRLFLFGQTVSAIGTWINFTAIETIKAFNPKVKGVVASLRNNVYFDKAWIQK